MSPRSNLAVGLRSDGFSPGEIANMLTPGATLADACDPIPLRWGLGDVQWGDDGSVIVMFSGPEGEPYWLELEADRATALRDDLAGPDDEPATADPATGSHPDRPAHGNASSPPNDERHTA